MPTLDLIVAERLAVADLLDGLTETELDTPSLCGDWPVRVVAAHLLMPLVTPIARFLLDVARAGGNFDKANDRASRAFARRPPGEVAAGLRAHAASRFHAPTMGLESALADLLIHGQDIRRPLGRRREFDPRALQITLDLLASPKALRGFVPRGRGAGVRFEVEELGWAAGAGAPVAGSGEAVMLAMTGRNAALDELTGDGVRLLRER